MVTEFVTNLVLRPSKVAWSRLSGQHYQLPQVALETLNADLSSSSDYGFVDEILERLPFAEFGAWHEQALTEYGGQVRNFEETIDDLIGIKGMAPPSKEDINRHIDFLLTHGGARYNLQAVIEDFKDKTYLHLADLGSICDVIILARVIEKGKTRKRVLEIGGGYGRLAEALVSNLSADVPVQIQMLDVVPSSLWLAEAYLRASGIKMTKSESVSDATESCVRLSTAEELTSIEPGSIDVVINIESFQEMTPEWVNWYLAGIKRVTKPGSFFYQSNSFGYKNVFDLELGGRWQLVSSFSHPRHWTDSHRTEIWQRVS
jgi:hypothetical protein